MMPSYKLTYFNAPARGWSVQNALQSRWVPFEDKRIEFQEWAAMKKGTCHVLCEDWIQLLFQSDGDRFCAHHSHNGVKFS